ncbi:MAG: substrate-binding domain-containing protein [Neisseriaceae bacterium]|nr:substrate-binding domain-containing protein [Neisseriaceae bacterium]
MKKWQVLGVSAALCAVFAVSGCNQQSGGTQNKQEQNNAPVAKVGGSKPAKGVKIGFAHCCVYGEISTMDASEDAIRKMANERGATLIFESANESQNKDNNTIQVEQVKNMIDKGAKSVIVVFQALKGKEGETAKQEILEYAKQKGVTIIAARRPADKSLHSRYNNVISVASSAEEAGTYQGRMVVDQWKKHPEWDLNEDGKMQILILEGDKSNKKMTSRTNFVKRTLTASELGDKLEFISMTKDEDTKTKRDIAKGIVAKWIKTGQIKKMEVIVGNTDDLVLGALDAFKEANMKPLPLFGMNAIDEAQEAVKNGEMAGTVLQDVVGQSELSYKIAENIALGKSPSDGIDIPFTGGTTLNVPYAIIVKGDR